MPTLDAVLGTGNSASNTFCTLTTTSAVAAGAVIVIVAGRFNTVGGSHVVTGGGLTWAVDHTVVSGSIRTSVISAQAPAGLSSSTAITVTNNIATPGDMIAGAASYLGIDTAGTIVVAINGAGASTAAWNSGSVGGNAGDLLVGGAFIDNGATSSSVPGGTGVERIDVNIPGQAETLTLVDKLTIAGADTIDGTWNSAGGHVAAAVAYKALAAGSVPPLLLMAQPAAGGI